MQSEKRRKALGDFLRAARHNTAPAQVGLPNGKRRRTPGLKREEIAQLANVSVTWYTWLEQGREVNPSLEVLENLAIALNMKLDERRHFLSLAGYNISTHPDDYEEVVPDVLLALINRLEYTPCIIIGRRWDILAWNEMACAVFDDFTQLSGIELNLVWRILTNRENRRMHEDWQITAQKVLAQFRSDYGRFIGVPQFEELLAMLAENCPEFTEWWEEYNVQDDITGRKSLDHPQVGYLAFDHIMLRETGYNGLRLMIYNPVEETDTLAKLMKLKQNS